MIYLYLFLEFFKIGLFTFGGGFAMIPLIEEVVISHGWLSEEQFFDFIGVCESTPGPIAINMATYIGAENGGILGSILATLGVVLPSFIVILLISIILKNLTKNRFFQGFVDGVQPVICALILSTGITLLFKTLGYVSIKKFDFQPVSIIVFILLVLSYFLYKTVFKKKLSAIKLIILSALLGVVVSLINEKLFI